MKFAYAALPVPMDLCCVALEECIHRGLPLSWVYSLHVGPQMLSTARGLVRHLIDGTKDNPFVPHINIVLEAEFAGHEWCIESQGVSFGSGSC